MILITEGDRTSDNEVLIIPNRFDQAIETIFIREILFQISPPQKVTNPIKSNFFADQALRRFDSYFTIFNTTSIDYLGLGQVC